MIVYYKEQKIDKNVFYKIQLFFIYGIIKNIPKLRNNLKSWKIKMGFKNRKCNFFSKKFL